MANSKSDFLERFKGRTMQMDKEGHLGVVMKTNIHFYLFYLLHILLLSMVMFYFKIIFIIKKSEFIKLLF